MRKHEADSSSGAAPGHGPSTGPAGSERVPLAELPGLAGRTLGPGEPLVVTQEQIDRFAAATLDEQWLHTDPRRAADGPFGTTIAHGYLTLSLATRLVFDLLEVPDASRVINYGLDRVRFPAPVPVGSALTMTVTVTSVSAVDGGYQMAYRGTIQAVGTARPACVLDGLFRYYGPDG